MSFLFVIWSNLWRCPTRSILNIMGVASGVAMVGISWGFQRSLERVYAAHRQKGIRGLTTFSYNLSVSAL